MTTALHLPWLPQFIIAYSLLTSPATTAQSLFNKAFGYEGYMGNVQPVSGPDGYVLCSNVRYGMWQEIDGFQFTRFDSTGTVIQTSAFSTGPLSYSLQHGALARSRSNGSFSFLFGGFTALRIFNTTAAGSVNWNKMVRYVNPDYLIAYLGAMDQSFEETPDGGYLITALREYPAGNVTDTIAPMIVKLDSTGDVLWNKTYDLGETCGWHITSHVDTAGGTLFGFHADTPCAIVSENCILTKIAPNGNTTWSKRVDGFQGRLTGTAMMNGQYAVSAEDSTSICILKMDTAGVPLWGKRYAFTTPLSTWGAGIIPTHDHGFVLRKLVPDVGGHNVFFFKVDSLGAVQWERTFGNGDDMPIDLVENKDSTFTLLTAGDDDFFMGRLDSLGLNDCITSVNGWLTTTTIPFSLTDVTLDEIESPMVSQPLYVNDSTPSDPVLIDGCFFFEIGLEEIARCENFRVHPNPTSGSVSVRITAQLVGARLSIIDLMGRELQSLILSSSETLLDLGPLPTGVYLYHVVTASGRSESVRLIKE